MLVSFCIAGVPSTHTRQPERFPFVVVLTPKMALTASSKHRTEETELPWRQHLNVTGHNFTLTLAMHFLAGQLH